VTNIYISFEKFPPGKDRIVVEHERMFIVLVRMSENSYVAFEDRCSHADVPLSDGTIDKEDNCVECPAHGARFDLNTGSPLCLPAVAPIQIFVTEVDNDNGRVKITLS
jgi:3-phenylpropionate/trans-cinnamate dioxygenase ferredoxin component